MREKVFGITVKKVLRRLVGCYITCESLQDSNNSEKKLHFENKS